MFGEREAGAVRPPGDDLLILFARGQRPTVRQVEQMCGDRDFVDAGGPGLRDYAHKVDIAPPNAIGLRRAGLTFDFAGLAPGPAIPIPDTAEIAELPPDAGFMGAHAACLRLGPHIAAGRGSPAVLREWFSLAEGILNRFDGIGCYWVPSGRVLARASLTLELGTGSSRRDLPVGLLAGFRPTLDGALQSQGLSYFTGQELRIEHPLVDGDEAHLARSIFVHLFYAGTIAETGQLAAPDGRSLVLEPSGNGRFVRVWPG